MNRLARFQRVLLYASSGFLFVTGAVWACVHYPTPVAAYFESDATAISAFILRIHGGAAVALSILLGTLLQAHVPNGWTSGRSRISGVGTLGVVAFLIATGYLLYYLGDEFARLATSYGHIVAGFIFPILIVVHVLRRQNSSPRECE